MLPTGIELGHFRLRELIGRSVNDVYLADDLHLPGREVAIKVMQTDITSFPTSGQLNEASAQFEREALIVSRLHHPHILPLFEYGQDIQNATIFTYLVMPYKKDGTLERWVKHRTASFRDLLPLQDISNLISTAADALQYAHDAGVIHREVRFSNFLIDNKTSHLDYPRILLADFGIAKFGENNQISRPIGTFDYMAPEQWDGHPTKASDQYALAVMTYKLLTGHMPFKGNPLELYRLHHETYPLAPSRIVPALPLAIDSVIFRALAKDSTDRYPSIKHFADALRAAILQPFPPLEVSLLITQEEALRGTTKVVKLPEGSELIVPVPPHAQNGQTISIAGRGKLRHDGSKGVVIITLIIAKALASSINITIDASPPLERAPLLRRRFFYHFGNARFVTGIGNSLKNLVARRKNKKKSETQLSLYALAHAELEADDYALIGKTYTLEAGIAQQKPENFEGEPFQVTVHDPTKSLLFHIMVHASPNIELLGDWYQSLNYSPANAEPQLVTCPFRLSRAGEAYLLVNFYREHQWLKSIRLEFEGIEQARFSNAARRG